MKSLNNFPSKAEKFSPSQKLSDKVKTLILSDEEREELSQAEHILITHAFNTKTTGLAEADGVKMIYAIYIKVKNNKVPLKLIKVLDKCTTPLTVFEIDGGEGYTYVMALKKAKPQVIGEYHSTHLPTELVFLPKLKFKDMADLYGYFMSFVLNMERQAGETAEELVNRKTN